MSEPTQNQNQVQIQENQYLEEAPSLCWGTSELHYDVSEREGCQFYMYFKRLKLLAKTSYTEDKYLSKRIRIYYYEQPMPSEESNVDMSKIPAKGIVIQEVSLYENEQGVTTQIIIELKFSPIQYTL